MQHGMMDVTIGSGKLQQVSSVCCTAKSVKESQMKHCRAVLHNTLVQDCVQPVLCVWT